MDVNQGLLQHQAAGDTQQQPNNIFRDLETAHLLAKSFKPLADFSSKEESVHMKPLVRHLTEGVIESSNGAMGRGGPDKRRQFVPTRSIPFDSLKSTDGPTAILVSEKRGHLLGNL